MAFGLAELVHGIYQQVPSVFVSLAQGIIQFTPGGLVTRGIELLGTADIPTLITSTVIGTLIVAALLGNLSLRRPYITLAIVAVLGVVAIIAMFAEPFTAPAAAIATVIVSLAAGCLVTRSLLSAGGMLAGEAASGQGEPARETPSSPTGRSREAHSDRGIAVGRGGFLLLSGGAAAAGLAAIGAGRLLSGGDSASGASQPKKLNLSNSNQSGGGESGSGGESTSGESTSGAKAPTHETLPPPPDAASLDVKGIPPLITPAKDFYLIDTVLNSPRVDVNSWKLSVKGKVDNPIEMTYKDLLSMNTREVDITLSCVSNKVGGGLISNGRWTGVLLSDVLAEAGVSKDKISSASRQLVGRSVDGFTTGFETKLALDGREALVAFGLNGSELPVKHGYPVRLVVPGLYGYVSATKWLSEIELTNWNFDTYWIQRTWTRKGPIKTQSRIDTVEGGDNLSAGKVPIGGVAWAPHHGISKVEVSTDGGDTWSEAKLAKQLTMDTWRQYVYDWDAKSGDHTLQVRATNGEGETQTAKKRGPHGGGGTDGATGYHTVDVTVS